MAINAVVSSLDQADLALMASLETDISSFLGRAIYEERKRTTKEHSVVADAEIDLRRPSEIVATRVP